jgi:ABC-type methionine transport system ATPase subunit
MATMDSAVPILEAAEVEIHAPDAPTYFERPEVFIPKCRIETGQFWVVGGLSTANPSGVIQTLAGLDKPAAGSIRLFGDDPADITEEGMVALRKRVGMVFSAGGRLLRNLTVMENIALPLRYHRFMFLDEIEDRVRELARALDLESQLSRPAVALSLSARQRVALARALVLEPEVLFLDRPLAVADADRHGWWLERLQALNRGFNGMAPMTVVLGTDSLHQWRGVEGRFAVIEERRWVPLGGTEEAKQHSALAAPDWSRQKQRS